MGLIWHEEFPLIVSRWHLDNCFYDGAELGGVSKLFESSSIGGLEMGIDFLHYSFMISQNHEHFEQCPECGVVYQMGPSPGDLERMRSYVPSTYAETD